VILCLHFLLAGSDQAFYSLSSSLGGATKQKRWGQTPMVHAVARQDSRVRENAQVADGDDGRLVLEQLLGGLGGERTSQMSSSDHDRVSTRHNQTHLGDGRGGDLGETRKGVLQ
jgi:hypothetical protein